MVKYDYSDSDGEGDELELFQDRDEYYDNNDTLVNNRKTRKRFDINSELFTKRLSTLSIDSAYESISRIPSQTPGEVVFQFLVNSTEPQPSVDIMTMLVNQFTPTMKIDLEGILVSFGTEISPKDLDSVVFNTIAGQTFTTLDEGLINLVVSYLSAYSLDGVLGYTRAGIRRLHMCKYTLAFAYFHLAVESITNRTSLHSAQALAWLGKCHLHGLGTVKSCKLAFECFFEAGRYQSSSDNIPLFLEFAKHSQDYDRIIWWLKQLSIASCQAQFLMSQCYFQGHFGVDVDMEMARNWLALAQSNGLFSNKGEKEVGIKWEMLEEV